MCVCVLHLAIPAFFLKMTKGEESKSNVINIFMLARTLL